MLGLVVTPGVAHSARVEEISVAGEHGVKVQTLAVGVCGTDREISEGSFGLPPAGGTDLVLGHEFLGRVTEDGMGFAAGDLVTATVRRGCGRCLACEQQSPDACDTGAYVERGITAMHGFARELIVEDPLALVVVPPSLGRLGVLAEPASIAARAIRHSTAIGRRQVWDPKRALVIGAGAIGMLATYMLRLDGHEVWTAARGPQGSAKAALVGACGARYISATDTSLSELREEVGGFDLVIESAGQAEVMIQVLGLLRRNGVGCLLGLDGRDQTLTLPGPLLAIDTVIENRVLFGSVNAHPDDWRTAVARLEAMRHRFPGSLDAMIGLRVSPDLFIDAFTFSGVKATLDFEP